MKQIRLTKHASLQCSERGTNEQEVQETIQFGSHELAKKGRIAFRMNFTFNDIWQGTFYPIKQVMPIVAEEETELVVVTVYTFFF